MTLERPWRDNRKNDSCIPPAPQGSAMYKVEHRDVPWSKFDYPHLIVTGVPNRSVILFHILNYYTQSAGCIGPGLRFGDLNSDGLLDAVNSETALRKLRQSIPEGGETLKVEWGQTDPVAALSVEDIPTKSVDEMLSNAQLK